MYSQSTIKLQITKQQENRKKERKRLKKKKRQPATRNGNAFQSSDTITPRDLPTIQHSLTEIKQKTIWNEVCGTNSFLGEWL